LRIALCNVGVVEDEEAITHRRLSNGRRRICICQSERWQRIMIYSYLAGQ
jgi:hypothetical protein